MSVWLPHNIGSEVEVGGGVLLKDWVQDEDIEHGRNRRGVRGRTCTLT